MRRYILLLCTVLSFHFSKAQLLKRTEAFTKADTLRGMLSPLRTCYDINYYHLDIKVHIPEKKISGSTLFKFTATQNFKKLQFDLFENLNIDKVIYKGRLLKYRREFNAVFIEFPKTIKKRTEDAFTVYYSGSPPIAKNAPWDGGFIFSQDASGKPWVGVACQGFGASSWWPCKDHQADEVDSMLISAAVPNNLMNISNGRLRSVTKGKDGYNTYNWFVSYPINNYTVTLNIGDYAHFDDVYPGIQGPLTLDYYVLKDNLTKAKAHFTSDVKPMLNAFEYWFGPYPFYRDGYKLIETPYLGMEHQSAISYGNNYKKGYKGTDLSGTGLGLKWDYIIVHESGHEWFGNNITSKDLADMWIHESFTTYSEGLFVEFNTDKEAGARYIKGLRNNISNTESIIGPYNVNKEGSKDMYYKGANMLHTMRTIIDDDKKWLAILRGLNKTYGLTTTTTEEILSYINQVSGNDFTKVFDQYLRFAKIPSLEFKLDNDQKAYYRWQADIKDFDMPVRIKFDTAASWQLLQPTTEWKALNLPEASSKLLVDTDNFYISTKFL
ncbi:MAG: M1 family metallopeptidase [Pyrinomonadaceae bacterium]|nr:M1 family metallopeptidase [Sphingobacteriaceae bacterium]